MLTNIRDVIFQKDPFTFSIDEKLCCFLEREGVELIDRSVACGPL
jgi:hypothetical protein